MGRDLLNIFIVRFNAAGVETKEPPPRRRKQGEFNILICCLQNWECARTRRRDAL